MTNKKLSKEDLKNMPYTDFVSLISEENRPPGGKKTIREFLKNSFLDRKSKVLEVGCTNGFTSLEITRLLGCKVWGIDINEKSLLNAKKRVKKERVKFLYGNAYKIPFKNNYFDMVVCSNATSFMENKSKAMSEYKRVVKPWGFIGVSPMYYIKKPPKEIISKISDIIGAKVGIFSKKDWINLFRKEGLEIYYIQDYTFDSKTNKEINNYLEESLDKPHLNKIPKNIIKLIRQKWKNIIKTFNNNLKYLGYSVILLRKREELEEIELFTTKTN